MGLSMAALPSPQISQQLLFKTNLEMLALKIRLDFEFPLTMSHSTAFSFAHSIFPVESLDVVASVDPRTLDRFFIS